MEDRASHGASRSRTVGAHRQSPRNGRRRKRRLALSSFPGLGKPSHPYVTELIGFSYKRNWIFFEADPDEARFIHIVSDKRDAEGIEF